MTTYTRLARFQSESDPGRYYYVSTDGESLSCDCPGWTRQTHYHDCNAINAGGPCECRRRPGAGEKTARTCKHVREVWPEVVRLGGFAGALRLVSEGRHLGPFLPPPPQYVSAPLPSGQRRDVREQHPAGCGCWSCLAVRESTAAASRRRRSVLRRTDAATADALERLRQRATRPDPAPEPARQQQGHGRHERPHRAIRLREEDE